MRARRSDVTLLQREMLSTFATLERFTPAPRVLEVDDAIWLRRGGGFARKLAEICELVVCGNHYLADAFAKWNRNVAVVPTGVDVGRFAPGAPSTEPVIGWSGTSGNLRSVYEVEPALEAALMALPSARVRIVCDSPPAFSRLPASRVEYIHWSPEIEVDAIRGMAVGIMPLADNVWTRGKCSFKMLTYMACGVPVVVSPVGMNADVLARGAAGLPATTIAQWTAALVELCREPALRRDMGEAGRRIVADNYSATVIAPMLARLLRGVATGSTTVDACGT